MIALDTNVQVHRFVGDRIAPEPPLSGVVLAGDATGAVLTLKSFTWSHSFTTPDALVIRLVS